MAAMESSGSRESQRIDIDNDESIRRWAKELGVTHVRLIDAVEKAGAGVDAVRRHLDQQMAAGQSDA